MTLPVTNIVFNFSLFRSEEDYCDLVPGSTSVRRFSDLVDHYDDIVKESSDNSRY